MISEELRLDCSPMFGTEVIMEEFSGINVGLLVLTANLNNGISN